MQSYFLFLIGQWVIFADFGPDAHGNLFDFLLKLLSVHFRNNRIRHYIFGFRTWKSSPAFDRR